VRLTAVVPATSANLGPGFDCFGLALDLCNEVTIDLDAAPGVEWSGEGASELPTDGTDATSAAMARVAADAGAELPPLRLRGRNRIPLERGLGSSAAAAVAGVALADRLLGLAMDPADVLRVAADLEGHPDNAAAAVLGGFTIAYGDGVLRVDPAEDLRPAVLVPDVRLATSAARDALPAQVTRADAVFNVGHAALAVVALAAQPSLLVDALKDVLHQPYRLPLVPAAEEVFGRVRDAGLAVCVSGAGPSLLAFETDDVQVPALERGWRVLRVPVRPRGVEVSTS
jgi:homoserine kinase